MILPLVEYKDILNPRVQSPGMTEAGHAVRTRGSWEAGAEGEVSEFQV